MSAADGDWTCANCNRSDRVTLQVRAANASYYLFCNACAVVVEDDIDGTSGYKPREGWTTMLATLIGPPQVSVSEPAPGCRCFCHGRITRYQCYYCGCAPAQELAQMMYMLGGK